MSSQGLSYLVNINTNQYTLPYNPVSTLAGITDFPTNFTQVLTGLATDYNNSVAVSPVKPPYTGDPIADTSYALQKVFQSGIVPTDYASFANALRQYSGRTLGNPVAGSNDDALYNALVDSAREQTAVGDEFEKGFLEEAFVGSGYSINALFDLSFKEFLKIYPSLHTNPNLVGDGFIADPNATPGNIAPGATTLASFISDYGEFLSTTSFILERTKDSNPFSLFDGFQTYEGNFTTAFSTAFPNWDTDDLVAFIRVFTRSRIQTAGYFVPSHFQIPYQMGVNDVRDYLSSAGLSRAGIASALGPTYAHTAPDISETIFKFFLKQALAAKDVSSFPMGYVNNTFLPMYQQIKSIVAGIYPTQPATQFQFIQLFMDGMLSNPNTNYDPTAVVNSFKAFMSVLNPTYGVTIANLLITNVERGTHSRKVLILKTILKLLVSMVNAIQQTAVKQADRLSFLTQWQQAYTTTANNVPLINKYQVTDPTELGTVNQKLQTLAENLRDYRSIVSDQAKQVQSNIDQSNQAISQQTNLGTSILQQMSSILQSLFSS